MNVTIIYVVLGIVALIALSVSIVKQGNVAVVTFFGKYKRTLRPGLNFRLPLVEIVAKRISLQHRSVELEFQAITNDQANVNFKTLILFAVQDGSEDTICKAAFRFVDDKSFMQSLIRIIEAAVRSFVASKKQNQVLVLREEIVKEVKDHIEGALNEWGYTLIDLEVNDISFDEAIMRSMAQVVATNNLKFAAENEAQAQYITKTRVAQAEAEAKKIIADAERESDRLRGEGNAMMRKNMADGLASAGKIMDEHKIDPAFMLYTMWLESMKYVASHSKGNILSFDGSNDGFDKTMKQMQILANTNGKKEAVNG